VAFNDACRVCSTGDFNDDVDANDDAEADVDGDGIAAVNDGSEKWSVPPSCFRVCAGLPHIRLLNALRRGGGLLLLPLAVPFSLSPSPRCDRSSRTASSASLPRAELLELIIVEHLGVCLGV
jgi:hypothetical protein